ncbi:antiviral helicase [Amylostereum chailletii]|nr:antiviral helicase [Amylostereum chailletii]
MDSPSLFHNIAHPRKENAAGFLAKLGLDGIPSREQIHREIEQRLLLPKERLPDDWLPSYQVSVPNPPVQTGLTSTSIDRAPGPSKNFVRGKSGYVPFWPGGLESLVPVRDEHDPPSGATVKGLRSVAPGLSRGLRLPGEVVEDEAIAELDELSAHARLGFEVQNGEVGPGVSEIDELLPTSRAQLNPVSSAHRPVRRANVQKRDWAHVVDINKPMTNFKSLYPFELDTFQKEAVYHLEMGDSVFVAAHTSAGKTVVAEYAIALAEKHMTRCECIGVHSAIYTSPIKALSNQKFRDFKQTFSSNSVGILTGDVQINPEANCLVMTTEILRSMLYKGADLIRDVEFVIFDEVHYVNDAERGVVWEEVIIMLPDHVNIILLSATVPNAKEFADWVGRTKKKDIYVIYTAKRPVPLEHFLYSGREMYKIVDAERKFLSQGYKEAGEAVRRKQDKEREAAGLPPVQRVGARGAAPQRGQQRCAPGGRGGNAGRGGQRGAPARGAPARGGGSSRSFHQVDKSLYVHLLGHLRKKALLPVVVFTLSKKRCEENASTLTNVDLSSAVERSEVHVAIEKAVARLKGSDRKLPQISRMRDLLTRGIGVHHGGLLPIVKEVVEILFARGLVKVLFATETFAMGVNMPAKCVVFSNIRKHDGRSFRDILPGEYTQMAGRAGRRGLDPTGTVIIIANDELPEQTALNTMILGKPGRLSSQFRLTYNMILNLLRVEALKVEEMIKRSFSENSSQRLLPDQQKKVLESEKTLSSLPKLECDICGGDIHRYYNVSADLVALNERLLSLAAGHIQGSKSLASGRVIVLRDGHFRWNAAVLLKPAPPIENVKYYWVLALVSPETKDGKQNVDVQGLPPRWPPDPESLMFSDGVYELAAVPLTSISLVTNRTIKYNIVHAEETLRANIASLKLAISDQNLELIPDYEQRVEVLKELKFVDSNSTVSLKGRVACEINSVNELVLTELVLENTLAAYEPEEVVALLSAFLFQEKTDIEPLLPPKLETGREAIIAIMDRVIRVQDRHKVSAGDFRSTLNFGLMEPFAQITSLTDVPEGTVVRVITRLDETCREVRDAARVIGDGDLMKKMEEAQLKIKRDIVFAASLYF